MTSNTKARAAVSAEVRAQMGRYNKRQRELAEVLGISQPQVSARLRGDVAWSVDDLATIAQWLGISPADLIGDAA